MSEWVFPDTGPDIGRPGSLTAQKYPAHDQTKISAYWPYVVYQGVSGEIRAAHYACHEESECWHDAVLNTTQATNGTRLVALPLAQNLSTMGLFYQEEGGRFLAYTHNASRDSQIWQNGTSNVFYTGILGSTIQAHTG